jgi:hypothetical protein
MFVLDEDAEGDTPMYSYFRGDELKVKSRHLDRILAHAVWDIPASVPEKTRDFVLLHAGAVSRHGSSMLIPAEAGVGKSSLVAGLLELGFHYLSDEAGVIDPVTRHAYPFPKRLSLDVETVRLFPGLEDRLQDRSTPLSDRLEDRFVRPEDLGAEVGTPAAIRWLIFPTPERDGPPRLTPIPSSEAATRMARYSFNLYRYEARGVVLLSRVAVQAEAFELAGGSVQERAELLASLGP